jgi:hypothetical protein
MENLYMNMLIASDDNSAHFQRLRQLLGRSARPFQGIVCFVISINKTIVEIARATAARSISIDEILFRNVSWFLSQCIYDPIYPPRINNTFACDVAVTMVIADAPAPPGDSSRATFRWVWKSAVASMPSRINRAIYARWITAGCCGPIASSSATW